MRETRNLTRMAMQGVIEDVGELVSFVSQTLESQVHAALSSHGVVPESIPDLDGIFSGSATKPFDGLYSFHQQVQYCRNHFNFIVSYYKHMQYIILIYLHNYNRAMTCSMLSLLLLRSQQELY